MPSAGMGINILLREEMGISVYTTMGEGWEWEYGHGNGREWNRKSRSRTSLLTSSLCDIMSNVLLK